MQSKKNLGIFLKNNMVNFLKYLMKNLQQKELETGVTLKFRLWLLENHTGLSATWTPVLQ